MTRKSLRRGFTLAEILITMVLIGFIAAAFTRVIIFQTRFYDQQNAKRNARAVSRNAMNVIMSDLRMVQDTLGTESLTADGKSITVRVPFWFGLVCASNAAVMTVSMLPADSAVLGMAQYGGYAWRNATTGLYTYVAPPAPTTINAPAVSAAPATCTGNLLGQARIATVTVNGRSGSVLTLTPGDAAAAATNAVFFWQRITYAFAASTDFPGQFALFRRVGTRPAEEIMGPFDATARFRIYMRGDDTSRTQYSLADTARVRGVDLVLNGKSQSTPGGMSGPVVSKMTSAVFFKNVRSF